MNSLTGTVPRSAPQENWQLEGTDYLFLAFMLLLFIEYNGLGVALPALAASRLPTLLAWGLALTIYVRLGPKVITDYTQNKLLVVYPIFSAVSIVYAVVQTPALTAFRAHLDYFGLFAIALYLIDRASRIKYLALIFAAIAVVMAARNVAKLLSPLRTGAMTGAYFTGDGNDFAWAMCTMIPLCIYPILTKQSWMFRLIGTLGFGACLFGIVGTQSRGAALAFVAMLGYYFVRVTQRKALMMAMVGVVIVIGSAMAPSYYLERMGTLQNVEEDSSATSRLRMWGFAIQMAADYPLGVGAGNFSQAYGLIYLPQEAPIGGWGANRWLNAHSVYFKALGEYGIIGLALVLAVIFINFRMNEGTHRILRDKYRSSDDDRDRIPLVWPYLVNISLVGYAVGGAFLGGLTYPHLYLISGLTAGIRRYADHLVVHDAASAAAIVPDMRQRFEPGAMLNPEALARIRENRRAS